MSDDGRLAALRDDLLGWYRVHARDLPWRRTRDPYRILVSEVMLQQTQVPRVEPAYLAFIERFPTVTDLASATTGDVLRQWQGLGYNRRAVNLHRAARRIVEDHDGRVPRGFAELRSLPGVGAYTARAVLVFAYGEPVAAVDSNVSRVLRRAAAGRPLAPRKAQQLGDSLVRPEPYDSAQALIELGASHCRATAPRCDACPVKRSCSWRMASGQAEDPAGERPRQSPFAGSDRFHRGRMLDALRDGPVAAEDLVAAARLDDTERARRIAAGLVRDGLARWSAGTLTLPGEEAAKPPTEGGDTEG